MYTDAMDSRQLLVDTMGELLWERGYADTSPRDVMARAGVGQGSMYHHFSGKHGLGASRRCRTVAEDLAGEFSQLEGEGSPLERIKRYLLLPRPGTRGCRVGRMTQDPQVVADAELITIVANAFDTALGRWEQAIAAAIAAGELPASIDPSRPRPHAGGGHPGRLRARSRRRASRARWTPRSVEPCPCSTPLTPRRRRHDH